MSVTDDITSPGPARQRLFTLLARMRPLLLSLLLLSALLTFVTADATRRWPPSFVIAAPIAFGLFLVLFAVYRLEGVRAGRYHAAQAFVQITLAALVFTLLLPASMRAFRTARQPDEMVRLLEHRDPEVRALAAETVRLRGQAAKYQAQLEALVEDRDPRVRAEAAKALGR